MSTLNPPSARRVRPTANGSWDELRRERKDLLRFALVVALALAWMGVMRARSIGHTAPSAAPVNFLRQSLG